MAFAQIGHAAAASTLPYVMNPIHHHAHSMINPNSFPQNHHPHPPPPPHHHHHPVRGESPKSDTCHVEEGFGVPPNYELRTLTQSWEANENLNDSLPNTLNSPTSIHPTSWYSYESQTNENVLTENHTSLPNNPVGDRLSPLENCLMSSTSYNYEFVQPPVTNSLKPLSDDLLTTYQHNRSLPKEMAKMNCKTLNDTKLSTDYISDDKMSPSSRNSIDLRHLDGDTGFQPNLTEDLQQDTGYTPYLNKLFATKALFTDASAMNRNQISYANGIENKTREPGSWKSEFTGPDNGGDTNTGIPESREFENFVSNSDSKQRDEKQNFSSLFNSSNGQRHPFTKLVVSETHVPLLSECLNQPTNQGLNHPTNSPTRIMGNSLTSATGAPPSDVNASVSLQAPRLSANSIPAPAPAPPIGPTVPVTSLNNFMQRSIPSTNVYSQVIHPPNAQVYPRPSPSNLGTNRFLPPNPYSFPGNMPPHPFMARPHPGLYPPGQPGHLRPFAPSSLHHPHPHHHHPHHHHHPSGQHGFSYGLDGARRKNATRESTTTLKVWLQEHIKNPYPTKGEKIMLAIITKMTLTQVSTWFANARRRLKKENKMTWPAKSSGTNNPNHKSPNTTNSAGGTKQLDDKELDSKNCQNHADQSTDMSDDDDSDDDDDDNDDDDELPDEQASESDVDEIEEVGDDFSGPDADYEENYLKLPRLNQTDQHSIPNIPQSNLKIPNYNENDRIHFGNNPDKFGRTSCDNIDKFKRQASFIHEEMFSPVLTSHGFSQTGLATSQLNSRNTLSFMFGTPTPFHSYLTSPQTENYEPHSQINPQITSEYLLNVSRKSPSNSSSFREDPEAHSNSSDPILISPNFLCTQQQPSNSSNIPTSLENHDPSRDSGPCASSASSLQTFNTMGSESVRAQTDRLNTDPITNPLIHTAPNLTMLRTVDYTNLNSESIDNYRLANFTTPSFGIH